jgi:hypothetical protein
MAELTCFCRRIAILVSAPIATDPSFALRDNVPIFVFVFRITNRSGSWLTPMPGTVDALLFP